MLEASPLIEAGTFYLFALIMLLSAVMVISSRNPVHSVLFLILAFFNAAGLFVLLGAEFVAMILVVVYVGAVMVLFLFVVMMLDINLTEMRSGFMQYAPVGALVGLVLLVELGLVYSGTLSTHDANQVLADPLSPASPENTRALGMLLYTRYAFVFEAAGLILLVAMIGAIVLTHRDRPGIRKQKISIQNAREPKDVLSVKAVTSGAGVDIHDFSQGEQ
jgi:NADH-quinone oxidoreductase subunit J